jgi:hypothetical protein
MNNNHDDEVLCWHYGARLGVSSLGRDRSGATLLVAASISVGSCSNSPGVIFKVFEVRGGLSKVSLGLEDPVEASSLAL